MTYEQETSVLNDVEAALAVPPTNNAPPKSKPTKKLIGIAILAALFGIYWYSDIVFYYPTADADCLKFAEETGTNPAFDPDPSDKKIFVVKKWIRNGNVVVELGQKVASKRGYFQSRLCVVGGGQIQIPSMLEQWQYK